MGYGTQVLFAVVLAFPVACIVWTVTQEELFKELRDSLDRYRKQHWQSLWLRKAAYMMTCPYCFSHYVTALVVWLCGFHMLLDDWRGYLVSLFTVVLLANVLLSGYHILRTSLRRQARADYAEANAKMARQRVALEEREHSGQWSVDTLAQVRQLSASLIQSSHLGRVDSSRGLVSLGIQGRRRNAVRRRILEHARNARRLRTFNEVTRCSRAACRGRPSGGLQ